MPVQNALTDPWKHPPTGAFGVTTAKEVQHFDRDFRARESGREPVRREAGTATWDDAMDAVRIGARSAQPCGERLRSVR